MRTPTTAACAAAAFLFACAAPAQSQPISNPYGAVANFDVAALIPILTELGVTTKIEHPANGAVFIGCQYGKLKFTLHPSVCAGPQQTQCVGLLALATFTGYNANYQTVMAFDERYAFADAGIFSDRSAVFLGRYDIADYGIARGNIAVSLGNFVGLANTLWQELETGASTMSAEGYGDDLIANALNRRQLPDASGEQSPPHLAALERIREQALDNVAAGADNRKILNDSR